MIHVVDQALPSSVGTWLADDLAAAKAKVKLVVGHVPLESSMGRTSASYRKALGSLLAGGGVAADFCGHEHLVWDSLVEAVPGRPIRQVIVGTPGATYRMPIKTSLTRAHCSGSSCAMPNGGYAFSIDRATRYQRSAASFVEAEVEVDGAALRVTPWTVMDDGALRPFAEGNA